MLHKSLTMELRAFRFAVIKLCKPQKILAQIAIQKKRLVQCEGSLRFEIVKEKSVSSQRFRESKSSSQPFQMYKNTSSLLIGELCIIQNNITIYGEGIFNAYEHFLSMKSLTLLRRVSCSAIIFCLSPLNMASFSFNSFVMGNLGASHNQILCFQFNVLHIKTCFTTQLHQFLFVFVFS